MFAFASVDRVSLLGRFLQRLHLRFPTLFVVFAVLTLADLVVPDVIPLAGEIGLALLTLLLGMWTDAALCPDRGLLAGHPAEEAMRSRRRRIPEWAPVS